MPLKSILGFGLLIISSIVAAQTNIKHIAPLQGNDPQKDFYILLLNRICDKIRQNEGQCQLTPVQLPMLQNRQFKSLFARQLDIVWSVTTSERELNYRAIKIPLLKGLMGARIAVLNNKHQALFSADIDLEKIKQLAVFQGHDWPDSIILTANGFTVKTDSTYNIMYRTIAKNAYDYTLRGVLELLPEMANVTESNIAIDQHTLFYYPSAIYFFVHSEDNALADKIETALNQMIDSGEFDTIFFQYPAHKYAFEQLKLEQRKLVRLKNPLLPDATPINDQRLWYLNPKQ